MDTTFSRRDLFPHIEPYETGMLDVGGNHRLYWEQSGNRWGTPVVFLHGGPGAGAQAMHRRFFDPKSYRIVIFDQRGCGRSQPIGDLTDNTTQHLVADMERLREHLGIERWIVFGGSWGSTLALAYGITHPERCAGFILRGVFLGRTREVNWFIDGIKTVFPEPWQALVEYLPPEERGDVLAGYYRRLCDDDPQVDGATAAVWCRFESACSHLLPRNVGNVALGASKEQMALARLEAHYLTHRVFLPEDKVLSEIEKLRDIPGVIVQGRYDMVCPIVTADEVARAWPEAEYIVVPDAGHSAMEPGVRAALVGATERFKRLG